MSNIPVSVVGLITSLLSLYNWIFLKNTHEENHVVVQIYDSVLPKVHHLANISRKMLLNIIFGAKSLSIELLSFRPFNDNLVKIQSFSFKIMHLNISIWKWRPFCLGLNELSYTVIYPRQVAWWQKTYKSINHSIGEILKNQIGVEITAANLI